MKHFLTPLIVCALSLCVQTLSAALLSEDFNSSALSTSVYSAPTDVELPSGTWTLYGVRSNKSNNVVALQFSSNDAYFITPAVDRPGKVSFKFRSGGSKKDLVLSYSADGGQTWTEADNYRIESSSSAFATRTVEVATGELEGVRFKLLVKNTNVYIDDFVIEAAQGDNPQPVYTEPTLIFSAASVNFMNVAVGEVRTRTLQLSGVLLEAEEVTLTSSDGAFLLSSDGVQFTSSLTFTAAQGTLQPSSFVVRFAPEQNGTFSGTLSAVCADAKASISVKGNGAETSTNEFYISPSGSDSGDGSFDNPWYNIQKAVNEAQPGDVIVCRGGTYSPDMKDSSGKTTVRIKKSGTEQHPITIRAYDGETPVFDFAATQLLSDMSMVGVRGFEITGDWWHLYGLTITHAGDNGIKLEGSHNRIERCVFCYNLDSGIQLGFGHKFSESGFGSSNDGTHCSYNDIVDCDSYRNCDFDSNYGSDADGFACKMHNGIGNRFIRCRAWENSDDAWDLYETDFPVVLIECWAWGSGRPEDHLWVKDYMSTSHGFSGNGNGIKMGGNGEGGSSKGKHEAWNCIAFNCNKTGSVKGFDQNSHGGGEKLVGCLAFGCGYDFMYEKASANSEYYNNVCLGRQEIAGGTNDHNALATPTDKGWTNNVVYGVSTADYTDLSEATAKGPRGIDGSMPATFARLKNGAPQIDAGLDLALPFADEFPFIVQPIFGNARDLGPYEFTGQTIETALQTIITDSSVNSLEVMQGQSSMEMVAKFSVSEPTAAELSVFNIQGQCVSTTSRFNAQPNAEYYQTIGTGGLTAGVYICVLKTSAGNRTAKFMVK